MPTGVVPSLFCFLIENQATTTTQKKIKQNGKKYELIMTRDVCTYAVLEMSSEVPSTKVGHFETLWAL